MHIFLAILLLLLGLWLWRRQRIRLHRDALLRSPIPDFARDIIAQDVPLIAKLPSELHRSLEGKINRFIDQVEFIGCNGVEVTDDMRYSVAAQACLLVVNTDHWFDTLRTILIYPGALKSKQQRQEGYVLQEQEIIRAGESWARGPVILSWQHSEAGARDHEDGQNVVIHEFANQIDNLSGHTDGFPILDDYGDYEAWQKTFEEAFDRLESDTRNRRSNVIDDYGLTGPEEFFAVSVELFFERPDALKRQEPGVYAQLADLFNLDPVAWR